MLTADAHPISLDLEEVLLSFRPIILARIRAFRFVRTTGYEDIEDCLQDVLFEISRKSATLGTSYLERYDPARGPARSYVLTFVNQHMMKRHNRERRRQELSPEPLRLDTPSTSGEDEARPLTSQSPAIVNGATIPDPSTLEEPSVDTIQEPKDLRRMLQGTRFSRPSSCSSRGEPRSTLRMLELLIWQDLPVPEIARRLEVSPSEVRRRFRDLRGEPWAQKLLTYNVGVAQHCDTP